MRKFILTFAAVAMSISGCATGRAAQPSAATASEASATVPTASEGSAPVTAASEATASAPSTAAPATAVASGESCPLPAHDANANGEAATAKTLVAPGMAKVGDRTSCPVSHETFVVKADSPSAEYNGKTYYFCCGHCAAKFEANPAKFARAE